jgi:acetyltransferase EpsM
MATVPAPAQAPDPGEAVSRRTLVILGAGEHARVVIDAARASGDGWEVVGHTVGSTAAVAGGSASSPDVLPGVPLLGTDADLLTRLLAQAPGDRPWLVLGFGGGPTERRRAVEAFADAARWAPIVHPTAWVSPSARIGEGAVVLAGAVVNAGALVGPHVIVNSAAVVEHDVRVGAFTHLAPGAVIGGGTTIGEGAMVGLGATVRDHIVVGPEAVVAMGAVVVADVPAAAVVLGVPARRRAEGRR